MKYQDHVCKNKFLITNICLNMSRNDNKDMAFMHINELVSRTLSEYSKLVTWQTQNTIATLHLKFKPFDHLVMSHTTLQKWPHCLQTQKMNNVLLKILKKSSNKKGDFSTLISLEIYRVGTPTGNPESATDLRRGRSTS